MAAASEAASPNAILRYCRVVALGGGTASGTSKKLAWSTRTVVEFLIDLLRRLAGPVAEGMVMSVMVGWCATGLLCLPARRPSTWRRAPGRGPAAMVALAARLNSPRSETERRPTTCQAGVRAPYASFAAVCRPPFGRLAEHAARGRVGQVANVVAVYDP